MVALTAGAYLAWGRARGWSFSFWLAGLFGYVFALPGVKNGSAGPPWFRWALALLLGWASVLRFVRTYEIPANIGVDEILSGLESLRIARGGYPGVFVSLGWFSTPNFAFTPAAVFMKLLSLPPFESLRLASAVEGILTVAATTFLGRELLGPRAALFAGFFLATSYWHVHESRTGFTYAQPALAAAVVLWLLVRAFRTRSPRGVAGAGVASGFALELYFPARIVLVLVPLAFVFLHRVGPLRRLRDFVAFSLGSLLVVFPLVLAVGPEKLLAHSYEVTLFRPATTEYLAERYGVAGVSGVLLRNARESLAMLYGWADLAVHNPSPAGLLDWATLVLFAAGVFLAATGLSAAPLFLLLWFGSTWFFGVVLGNFPRASYRLAPALPAVCLLAAYALDTLLRSTASGRTWYRQLVRTLVVGGVLTFVALENVDVLFVRYARGNGSPFPMGEAARLASRSCDGSRMYYGLPESQAWPKNFMELFCSDYEPVSRGSFPPEPRADGRPRTGVFFIMAEHEMWTRKVRECYPSARFRRHEAEDGRLLFVSAEVGEKGLRLGPLRCGRRDGGEASSRGRAPW
ncbi:MAG: hypothetical protein KatS3mg076_2570 [Candidatus Binatia bacterium]|nr:MAG: hypothetical protein KatS3mg076_2570 [Candidatus Binatia bacterium]